MCHGVWPNGNGHTAASVGPDAPKDNHHDLTAASAPTTASRLPGEVKAAGIRGQLQAQLASVDRPAHGAIDFTREAVAE
jgi:hypothetical protein